MKASISALTGSREAVTAALATQTAPQSIRDCIAAVIAELPAEFNGCRVDCHGGNAGVLLNYNISVKPINLAV